MPYFPARFLTHHRLALLETTDSFGIEDLEISKAIECLNENTLNKIKELTLKRTIVLKVKT